MDVKLRRVVAVVGLLAGLASGAWGADPLLLYLGVSLPPIQRVGVLVLGAALGGLIGFIVFPQLVWAVLAGTRRLEGSLSRVPIPDMVAGTVGLISGLLIANLLTYPFSRLPSVGPFLPPVASIIIGYLGASLAVHRRDELAGLVPFLGRWAGKERPRDGMAKILDTSAIIDGRIVDVCQTGFLEGPVVIPSFVLEELRHIADSADGTRRNRGRRGLEVLAQLQQTPGVPVQVWDKDVPGRDVDSKLLRLARQMRGKVVTNDFNLNRVCAVQGIPVLNLNELANALKPRVLPGEEMSVHILRDGKEAGQGVGYLDDGTMIVVEGGKRHIGETIEVAVTSVLQTAAGRMIFARPKLDKAG
ncbi:MAG: TRAM domain-containing protein [Bacillota bacterium]|nr:TRAM domain-containing protein [Bacillota bacterium]